MVPMSQSNNRLPRGTCPCCQRDVALRRGGELREHFHGDPGDIPIKCMGSGLTIAQAQANIDAEISALRRMTDIESRTRHTAFENLRGGPQCWCDDCSWKFQSGSQSACTAAAKRHVDANPMHYVWTQRIQTKMTYRRRVKASANVG